MKDQRTSVNRPWPGWAARMLDSAAFSIEHHQTLLLCAFSAIFLIVCSLISATKLMWFDEMATYYPARFLSWPDMLAFFGQGLDVHTPTASIVLRASMKFLGDSPVTNRLPFAIGYLVMCLCIFRFVSRRCPAVYAAAAMIFPAVTSVFYYATEIRSYGLLLGLTGVALVCWQAASEGKSRAIAVPGLFLSLVAALCCHYYAAFLWIPFGLAEITRAWMRKRPDLPVWLALLLSPAILLVFVPAIRAARSNYLAGMWAKPNLGQIENAYRSMLTLSFAPILGGVILLLLLVPRFSRPADTPSRPPLPERVLVGALALVPAIVVPFSYLIGAYVVRYSLYSIAGISIFLAFAVCWMFKGDLIPGFLLAAFFLVWFVAKNEALVKLQMAQNGGIRTPLAQPFQTSSWMRALDGNSLPVMATPAVFFMQLQHYAPDPVRSRVIYAADEALALEYDGIYTGETNLLSFSRMLPLRVTHFDDFLTAHPHFLLAAETTNPTWHIPALQKRGAVIRFVNRFGTYFVFDVTLP